MNLIKPIKISGPGYRCKHKSKQLWQQWNELQGQSSLAAPSDPAPQATELLRKRFRLNPRKNCLVGWKGQRTLGWFLPFCDGQPSRAWFLPLQPSPVSENLKSFPPSYQGNHSPAGFTVTMERKQRLTTAPHLLGSREAETSDTANIPCILVQGPVFLQFVS